LLNYPSVYIPPDQLLGTVLLPNYGASAPEQVNYAFTIHQGSVIVPLSCQKQSIPVEGNCLDILLNGTFVYNVLKMAAKNST